MKAVGVLAVVGNGVRVAQNKADLDDPGQTRRHQSVSKNRVHHGAQHQSLRVCAHRPAGHENDDSGDEVSLRTSVTVARQPHTHQSSAPPDDAHGRVLQVVVHPGTSPAVFGEGIDTAPGGDDGRVEELLRAVRALDPDLADQEQDREEDAVRDERRPHDEMRETLSRVIASAESQRYNPTEQHLHPCNQRHGLSQHTMSEHHPSSYLAVDSLFEMEFEIYTHDDLTDEHQHQEVRKFGVNVRRELSTLVSVAEKVAYDCQDSPQDLGRNVPSAANDSEDHAGWEEDSPCCDLDEDVYP